MVFCAFCNDLVWDTPTNRHLHSEAADAVKSASKQSIRYEDQKVFDCSHQQSINFMEDCVKFDMKYSYEESVVRPLMDFRKFFTFVLVFTIIIFII